MKIESLKEALLLLSDFIADSELQSEKSNLNTLDSTSPDFWRLQRGTFVTTKNIYSNLNNTNTHSKTVVLLPTNNKKEETTTEMKKLKYGQGSISVRTQVRKSGKIYKYYSITVYDGVKNHVRSAKTLEKAQEKLAELNKEFGLTKERKARSNDITFFDWLDKWYITYKKHTLKPSSQHQKEIVINLIKRDYPSNVSLKKVKTEDLQVFLNFFKKTTTAKNTLTLLKEVFDTAQKTDLIRKNPTVMLTVKKHITRHSEALSFENQAYILKTLEKQYSDAFYFLCCTGLRIGEYLALSPSDFKNGFIVVNKSYDLTHQVIVDTTKTQSSERKIPFLPELMDRFAVCNKPYSFYRTFFYKLKKIYEKIEIKGKIHTTRHTFASVCHHLKYDDKQIQSLMGHATISMTLDCYTDLLNKGNSPILEYLERLKEIL